MKSIAVFGASGMTGVCVLKTALDRGCKVRALLRDPKKLPEEFEGLVEVVQGDVLNVEDVRTTVQNQDGVVVVLGTRNDLGPTTALSEGLKNILAAMDASGVNVVTVCLSMYLFLEWETVPALFRDITEEHRRMLRALESTDLHWVAVNASHITDQDASGYTTRQGCNTRYLTVSKHDLARLLVDSLAMPELFQKQVGVASIPRRLSVTTNPVFST